MATIDQIEIPSGTYDLQDKNKTGIYTVIGTQTAATGSWTGALHGVSALYDGLTISYFLPYAGSGNATLNLTLDNGSTTGAVNCYLSASRLTTHYTAGTTIIMTYWSAGSIKVAGTATTDNRWIAHADYNTNSDTIPSAYCPTPAATAAKVASMSYYTATAKSYVHVNFRYANSVAGAITLNINSQGAKPIYINGTASSASNYTLPAGPYLAYYDGTNYYLRTDGKLQADITGNAATATTATKLGTSTVGGTTTPIYLNAGTPTALGYTIAKSVPSDAKFTDTTYESKAAASGGTAVSLVTTGEKYTWNNKSNLALGTTSTTALKGDTKYAGASTAGGSATSAAKLDTATAGSATQPCYFANGVPSACTYSLNKSVPSDAVFTDTNDKVTQNATTTSADYEVLFSGTADNTTRTEGVRKNSNLKFNPSTGNLQATQLNGVTIGSSPKFTDTTYSNATQSVAGLMSTSDKTKLDKMYTVVTTEAELTSALATANNNILVVNSFTLTSTIAITQNNTNLTFNKNAVFDMSGKNFAFITVGTANTKPTYVTINNPKAQGNKTSGSIGINLLGVGFGSSINSPTLQSFDTGIKANSFDCAQLMSIYEPVIQGCNIGIDDSLGGLQAVRIHGGRIEGNTNWGVKIGSPNANFMGTVLEGNGTNLSNGGEVYFTNVSTNRSSAVFANCYFETESTTNGNIITANSNWLGNVSLTNCEIYNLAVPVVKYTGSDTKERAISIIGGNVKGTVMVNLPNVGNSTSIFISNVLYDDSTNAIDANINANANKFISGKNVSTTSIVRGKSFMAGNTKDGVVSAENVYSKILQIDTPSGNNNFIRLTQSASNPWADTSVGVLKGSLHYNSAINKWFQRVTTKGTTDVEANWSPLILANTPHTEISASGSGNNLYFSMPNKNQWLGKKLCICAWRTNESDVNKNPPKFMWEFYVPTNWAEASDDFDVYSAYRRDIGTLHDTYITVNLDYSNNKVLLMDDGFYARNLNGTSFYLYLYHSLMTYKLVIL